MAIASEDMALEDAADAGFFFILVFIGLALAVGSDAIALDAGALELMAPIAPMVSAALAAWAMARAPRLSMRAAKRLAALAMGFIPSF
jgi:hypothetical protein